VLEIAIQTSRRLGPYVLLELLLPGGTMFALALFLYRRPEIVRRYATKARAAALAAIDAVRTAVVAQASSVPLTAGIETAVRAMG